MDLENKFLYRFIKVFYIVSIIVFFFWFLKEMNESWASGAGSGLIHDNFFVWLFMSDQLPAVLFFLFVGLPIYYILINIIRETLIYLFFGRKFTWLWLFPWKKDQ